MKFFSSIELIACWLIQIGWMERRKLSVNTGGAKMRDAAGLENVYQESLQGSFGALQLFIFPLTRPAFLCIKKNNRLPNAKCSCRGLKNKPSMQTMKLLYGITLALTCGLATTLKAQDLYVVSYRGDTVGEYTTSGAAVNASLISGLHSPQCIAISGNDLFVSDGDSIGEYTTSGAVVNLSLISGLFNPYDIAISGNDLFVCNSGAGTVGEYTTSGATVNASLISGLNLPLGIAISGNDLFVSDGSSIGEYTTSGVTVNASLISGLRSPRGIAISGNDLFVANSGSGTIGEYTSSGAVVNASLVSGFNSMPWDIATDGNDLFVTLFDGGRVGEYTTSGVIVSGSLVSGLNLPFGIAMSPVPEPSASTLAGLGGVVLWLWCRRK